MNTSYFCESSFAIRKNMNILRKIIIFTDMLILTSEELIELTDRLQPAAQIRWLKERGWLYEIGGN